MVFSSLPLYLDPPNWHQQQQPNHNIQQGNSTVENPQLPPLPPPPPHHVGVAAGGGGGSAIRPGSMADRARLAKIPQPEAALKCPRCESTNTKFCYFNNYSLSQPRHFCKTCRRYWTRGGALRNVPVGGGCRRNKKNKSSGSSKAPASADKQAGSSTPATTSAVNNNITSEITAHLQQQTPHLPFMASLQSFSQYGLDNIGLNFGGSGQADLGFQLGTNSGMSSAIHQQQQFPFFEPASATTNGLYPFQSTEGMEGSSSMVGMSSSSRVSQVAPVKMEGLNLSRPSILGGASSENNQQFWGGNSWNENLSGLNSSTTNHLL